MLSLSFFVTHSVPRHVVARAPQVTHRYTCQRVMSNTAPATEGNFSNVYVHQVSKNVLEDLQSHHHEFMVRTGLDRGLRINDNGTFVLHFPAPKGRDAGRVWTSYDVATNQHWLSVYRRKLKTRFLLKDSSSTMDSEKVKQKIGKAIAKFISALEKNIVSTK